MSLSSPGHAVSLFRRQPFWEGFWVRSRGFARRDAQTQRKVPTVYFEGNWRCKLRPKAAKPPFFIDSGRNVWHWRSLQRRSKNGVLELARPCCFAVLKPAFLGQTSCFCRSWRPNAIEGANGGSRSQIPIFYRFWTQRLTLKITPTQVKKRCPWARQAMLFPCSGGSLFGKAFGSEVVVLPVVTPKRNGRCQRFSSKPIGGANWAPQLQKIIFFYRFWTRRLTLKITPTQVEKRCPWARQAMLFPCSGGSLFGKAFGSEVVVLPVVTPKRNGRCQRCISKAIGGANCAPKLQNLLFFIDSGRNVWHWRSLQRRSKNGVLELARPCCFPVPEAAFLGRLLGQKSWFCPSWRPNATEGANGVFRRQLEVQIAPQSCKTSFFYRFWTQRLTVKITPTQVEKRCPWARQAMLFPCSGGSLFGKAFGSEVVVLPVVTPKRNGRCQRCISKAIGGANCAPKLQNLLFL